MREPELTLTHKPISLVGMPGGGKSTVGRHLARRLGTSFADTDVVIERHIGYAIRTFFEQEGEDRFRQVEAKVFNDLIADPPGVIATGGGLVLLESNRAALRDSTVCVYLRSSPEELFRRLRHDMKRPLLQVADPLSRLRDLFSKRDPLYRDAARFIVETGRPSVPTLVNMILMQLELGGVIGSEHVPSPIDSTGNAP